MIADATDLTRPLIVSNRSTWSEYRFDQFAQNVTDRVDNPAESGVERYVGLEHLDPESLQIRRWGAPTDVEATKLRFQPGDIIFGKRRAYQRKVAVADFEGICSAHALVLRARPDVVDPDFLPFFMQSDVFFDRALAISVGSLSPTINWRTLAAQEFALPPMEEQRRIAEVLGTVDQAYVSANAVVFEARNVRRVWFNDVIEQGSTSSVDSRQAWRVTPLRELWTSSPRNGFSAHPTDRETGVYVLALSAITENGYRTGELKSVEEQAEVSAARLGRGDLLVSRSNTIDRVGLAAIFDEDRDDVSYPDTMMRLEVSDDLVLKRFLERVLLSSYGRAYMRSIAAGTSASMKKINRTGLGAMAIPLPSLSHQEILVDLDQRFVAAIDAAGERQRAFRELRTRLINAITQDGFSASGSDVQ